MVFDFNRKGVVVLKELDLTVESLVVSKELILTVSDFGKVWQEKTV